MKTATIKFRFLFNKKKKLDIMSYDQEEISKFNDPEYQVTFIA